MGGHAYWYFTAYDRDANTALQRLRRQEFEAGRYNPVVPFPDTPPGPRSASPGPKHRSIEDAREAAGEDGTRSILDIERVAPSPDFFTAAPLPADLLTELYETSEPTRHMIEENMDFLDDIERGQAAYLVVYKDGRPDELCFAGYSFD